MITVEDVVKRYGSVTAVAGVSMSIAPGEVVGFLGPNGAGKSTTLKMLTGYVAPTSGRVAVGGIDVAADRRAAQALMGYLPEHAPLYHEMGVVDALRFACRMRRVPRKQQRTALERVIHECHLEEVLEKNIHQCSKGYRQRVGLAQALIADPPVLVLDEPTTGLDPKQRIEMLEMLRKLGRKKTIILSTHILSEAARPCDRILIIHRGRLVGAGSPKELEERVAHGTRIVVRVNGVDKKALLAALRREHDVDAEIEPAGEGLRATIASSEGGPSTEDLFRLAVREGWVLAELRRDGGTLEDVFLELTRGERA